MELGGIQQILNYYINVVFLTFRICPIMPQVQFLYKMKYIYVSYKMVGSGVPRKSAHCPHSAVKIQI